MHLINCPWVFSTCWAAIKGYLPERTSRKIHVNGNNFVEELLEVGVPLNIIPSDYGGGGKAFDDYALLYAFYFSILRTQLCFKLCFSYFASRFESRSFDCFNFVVK